MKTITVEQAQTNFDHYLAEVEAGETYLITVNGEPVAQFVPTTAECDTNDECFIPHGADL
jgi:prevent-host-death family protein